MKKLIFLIISLLLLSGCGKETAPVETIPDRAEAPITEESLNTDAETAETAEQLPAETEESIPLSADAYQIVYNVILEDQQESAVFQGIGPDGSLAWTYETGVYPTAQLSRISPVGRYQDNYYLVEDGTIVALDILTGEILFKNEDFKGSPAEDAMLFDEFGYLYLAGYDGPHFFAMDPDGNTVKRTETLSEDYWNPFQIQQEGDQLIIYMESDANGSGNFPCYVERTWLPQPKG